LEGTSPDKQLENILALANRQGYSVNPKHIWQNAESGSLKGEQREGFQHSLSAAESGEISRVYVFSLDRLGRDLIETLVYLRALTDRGADCWEAEHGQPLKHDDLVVMILGAVASNERKQILSRTRDGQRRAISAGRYSGGIVAYGYQSNPITKTLEINETEAEVVRLIFQWAIEERMSSPKIADRLNALNIPTHYTKDERMLQKGKRAPEKTLNVWRQGQVYRILTNKAYAGHWVYGKRSKRADYPAIEGYCPPIITEETFQQAQEAISSHRLNPRNVKREYLLRGLIHCGLCGRNFTGEHTKTLNYDSNGEISSSEVRSFYYVCGGRRSWKRTAGQKRCENVYIGGKKIEEFIWNDVRSFCQNPETAINQLRTTYEPLEEKIEEKIQEATKRLEELNQQEVNALEIASKVKIVDVQALETVLEGIRRKQATLVTHIEKLRAARQVSLSLDHEIQNALVKLKEIAGIINNATFEEKRNAILSIVKSIEITPREVDGKRFPHVKIVYRFSEPVPEIPELSLDDLIVFTNHTSRRSRPPPNA